MLKTLRHLFTPHHTNNHRPRVLHPMGMAVMVAFLLAVNSGIGLLETKHPQGLVLGYASNINAYQVLQETNQERKNQGLQPLVMNDRLNQAAAGKARDMFTKDYWAHIAPDGVTPWNFIKGAGYSYTVAGENLARDFDTTVPMVEAWMASPTHKANIVHTQYTETGIAVVNGTLDGVETTLVVQMFGTPVQPALANAQPQQPTPAPQITQEAPEPEFNNGVIQENEQDVVPQQQPEVAISQPLESAVLSETETQTNLNSRLWYISPLDLRKSAVLAIIFMIMGVLVVDEIIIRHKQTARFVGRNVAHLSFLALALIIVWNMIQPGLIQ